VDRKTLQLGLAADWVTVGFAMTIAALSQWKTVSMFHLFLCGSLADVIPIIDPTWTGRVDRRSGRLQAIYLVSYRVLRVAILSYVIHRFRLWSNTPGQCFIPYVGGTGHPREVSILIQWTGFSIGRDVLYIISALAMFDVSSESAEDPDEAGSPLLDRVS
jgi:hypothetical protein